MLEKALEQMFGAGACAAASAAMPSLPPARPLSGLKLKVELLRGRGLQSKDANGLSDPYAMVEVLPGGAAPGLIHRKHEHAGRARQSSIKPKTLDPEWNEAFEFELSPAEARGSKLMLYLWDADEAVSVSGGIKAGFSGLRKGLAGMKNFVKDLAPGRDGDSFLGWSELTWAQLDVGDASVHELELQKRSKRSRVSGSVVVRVSLQTLGVPGATPPSAAAIMAHSALVAQVVGRSAPTAAEWDGALPDALFEILRRHRASLGLGGAEHAVAEFAAMADFYRRRRAFPNVALLREAQNAVLKQLGSGPPALRAASDQVLMPTIDSVVTSIVGSVGMLLADPVTSKRDLAWLSSAAELLAQHYDAAATRDKVCAEASRSLAARYEKLSASAELPEDAKLEGTAPVVQCVRLEHSLSQQLRRIRKQLGAPLQPFCNLWVLAVQAWDLPFSDRVCALTQAWGERAKADADDSDDAWHIIFEAYFAVRSYVTVGLAAAPPAVLDGLAMAKYETWFQSLAVHWVKLSELNGAQWIDQAVAVDSWSPITDDVCFSSSLIDVFSCLAQIQDFFESLGIPELGGQMVDVVCRLVERYANAIVAKAEQARLFAADTARFGLSVPLCIALNNLDGAVEKFEELAGTVLRDYPVRKGPTADADHAAFNAIATELFGDAKVSVRAALDRLFASISGRAAAELAALIRQSVLGADPAASSGGGGVWCLFSAAKPRAQTVTGVTEEQLDAALAPVLDWADANLLLASESSTAVVMQRFCASFWHSVLCAMCEVLARGVLVKAGSDQLMGPRQRSALLLSLFLNPISSFFHQDGDGLSHAAMQSDPLYTRAIDLTWWAQSSTDALLVQYYRHCAATAATAAGTRGKLVASVSTLPRGDGGHTVKVFLDRGEGLPAMDRNGKSDPYCEIELLQCAGAKKQAFKSKKISNTLEPHWRVAVDFAAGDTLSDAVLRFRVYDADRFASKPDPMGETAAVLVTATTTGTAHELELQLAAKPPETQQASDLLAILRGRAAWDPEAAAKLKDLQWFYSDSHRVHASK